MPGGISPPPEVILSWPQRSLEPERRGWGFTVAVIILWVTAAVVVVARLIARVRIQRNAGLDDLFIGISFIPLTGLAGCIAAGARWLYFDRHAWDLTPQQAVVSRKLVLAEYFLYIASTSATKISILLFYRRMSAGALSPGFHWAVRICIATVFMYWAATTFVLFGACQPFNAFWRQVDITWIFKHQEGKDWHCFHEAADLMSATCISMVHDFIACLLPVVLFRKLQLPRKQKIALAGVFFLGGITCIIAVVRIYYMWLIFYGSYDTTWVTGPAWIAVAFEAHLGVIAASLPALKIYFKKHLSPSRITGSLSSWRSRYGHSGPRTAEKSQNSNFFNTESTKVDNDDDYAKFDESPGISKRSQDVELGGIEVTREVEVESAYVSPKASRHAHYTSAQSSSQPAALRHSPSSSSRNPLSPINDNLQAHQDSLKNAWLEDASSASSAEENPQTPKYTVHAI